jgi:hypothetical protein
MHPLLTLIERLDNFMRLYIATHTVKGKLDGFNITLKLGDPTFKMFFDTYHQNPYGLKQPYKPVARLILVNEGLCDIFLATNLDESSEDLTGTLRSTDDVQIDASGKTIENLFMKATTSSVNPGATTAFIRLLWVV